MKRTGKTGAQIVMPNFTALPLPEFNLLWTNKVDRKYQREILNYFRKLKTTQFIIATHAEEFIKGVEPENIYSVKNKS